MAVLPKVIHGERMTVSTSPIMALPGVRHIGTLVKWKLAPLCSAWQPLSSLALEGRGKLRGLREYPIMALLSGDPGGKGNSSWQNIADKWTLSLYGRFPT
jgi:hypothetical protein